MTITTLTSKRATAGARYAAALLEFRSALVDLAAVDGALQGKTSEDVRSFGTFPNLITFRHPIYAPDVTGHLPTEVTEKRNQCLKTLVGSAS